MWNHEEIDSAFENGYRALGEVVYFFQQLEDELRRVVSFLIDPNDSSSGDIVACELSFKQLNHIAYSLFELYVVDGKEHRKEEWRSILADCLKAEEHRNSILHSTFGVSFVGEETPSFQRSKVTAKFKRGYKEHVEALDEKTMNQYLSTIGGISGKIGDFMGRTFPDWNTRQWKPPIS